METPGALSIGLFVATLAFLVYALVVRFARDSRPLNFVQYARVGDPAALHRWTGNRLLLLPVASLVGAVVAFRMPAPPLLILLAWALVVVAVVLWLAVGAGKFHQPRT
jgi:hypothetical protein